MHAKLFLHAWFRCSTTRTVWLRLTNNIIRNVSFARTATKCLPTLRSTWKVDFRTANRIGTNCSPPNALPVHFQLKPAIVGSKPWTTTITVNVSVARSVLATWKEKAFTLKAENRIAKLTDLFRATIPFHTQNSNLWLARTLDFNLLCNPLRCQCNAPTQCNFLLRISAWLVNLLFSIQRSID